MSKNTDACIEMFLKFPGSLGCGAGKMAKRWGFTPEEVREARMQVRKILSAQEKAQTANYIAELETKLYPQKMNFQTGEQELTLESNKPLSPEEIEKLANVDNVITTVSMAWLKSHKNGTWTYSISIKWNKQAEVEKTFVTEFQTFLQDYKPSAELKYGFFQKLERPKVSLILPKQDAHFNKYDIYGSNDIQGRFDKAYQSTLNMVVKASATATIEEIVYIVGSDQFNSEWTSLTTKGTPQQNILCYQEAFTEICNHEVEIIKLLTTYAQSVKVVFIPGNHDEYVGWHLINWLESYYRENSNISFNSSIENTKYYRYNNTAVMLNHGDDMKAKDLAQKFPIGFKDQWSLCDNFIIISGDKHHEMSLDISGIKFFQVPQLSSARSKWDDKKGFESRAENTAFVITEKKGLSDILKEML